MGGYEPLKSHPFFESISWDDLHLQTPPKLTPYLPAMSEDDEDCYGNVNTHTVTTKMFNNLHTGPNSSALLHKTDSVFLDSLFFFLSVR